MTLSSRLRERIVEAWGEESTPELNYMADVCQIIADEMDGWTHRTDDAMRIPDVIAEAGRDIPKASRPMTNPLWDNSSPHNARLLREQLGIDEGDHDDYDQAAKVPPQMPLEDKADELYQAWKEGDS